jgi:uncharacterized protein HemX
MAVQQRNPNDPSRDDLADDSVRRSARLEQDQHLDPQLSESKMSGGKIAAFAVAIALAFGAIFYGMNATSNNPTTASQTTPATQNSAQNAPPAVRDVTPSNSQPGMTTGAAPSRPQPAPTTPGNGAPAR